MEYSDGNCTLVLNAECLKIYRINNVHNISAGSNRFSQSCVALSFVI